MRDYRGWRGTKGAYLRSLKMGFSVKMAQKRSILTEMVKMVIFREGSFSGAEEMT